MNKQVDWLENAPTSAANGWPGALDGMKRAAEHAESCAPGWGDRALDSLRAYIDAHPREVFIAPTVRVWSVQHGLDEPPNEYAWGNVFRRAARLQLIVRAGWQQYGNETMHTQSVNAWRAASR